MAVGVKATAWPLLVSPLDAISGRYTIVLLKLHTWHKNDSNSVIFAVVVHSYILVTF